MVGNYLLNLIFAAIVLKHYNANLIMWAYSLQFALEGRKISYDSHVAYKKNYIREYVHTTVVGVTTK